MATWSGSKSNIAVNKLSKKIVTSNVNTMVFGQFTYVHEALGKNAGDTIQIPRVSHPADAANTNLGETTITPATTVALANTTVTVKEVTSNEVEYTGKYEALSEIGPYQIYVQPLENNMAEGIDTLAGAAFTGCKIKYTPTGTDANPTATFDTDGTVSTAALRHTAVWDLSNLRKYFRGTSKTQPYSAGLYVAVLSTGAAFRFERDGEYQEVLNYADPKARLNGEKGKLYGFRIVEENNVLTTALGTTSYEGEIIAFGEKPVCQIVAMPQRVLQRSDDYGREKAIAIFWMGNFGEVWPVSTAREAKIISVEST